MKRSGKRVMVAVIFVALSFQGASVAVQRLWMPAHYHVLPALPDDTVLEAQETPGPQPLVAGETSRDPMEHAGRGRSDHGHGHEHGHDQDHGHHHASPSPHPPGSLAPAPAPAIVTTEQAEVGVAGHQDARHAHTHAGVRSHRHDRLEPGLVVVAEEGDLPATALVQRGLDGFWSLLPGRIVVTGAAPRDPLPAFTSVKRRLLASSAPERPPRV